MFGLSGADQLQSFEKSQVLMFVHYYFYLQIKAIHFYHLILD